MGSSFDIAFGVTGARLGTLETMPVVKTLLRSGHSLQTRLGVACAGAYFLFFATLAVQATDTNPATPPTQVEAEQDPSTEPPEKASPKSPVVQKATELQKRLDVLQQKDPQRAASLQQGLLRTLLQYEQALTGRPAPPGPKAQPSPPQTRMQVATELLEDLRELGEVAVANRLAQRLEHIRQAKQAQSFPFIKGTRPEVHVISVNQGTTLPESLKTKENRLRLGYAEVHLRHSARPILLVLRAQESILWKIESDANVQLHAIILDSSRPQQLLGVDGAMVLNTREASQQGLIYQTAFRSSSLGDTLAGQDAVTELKFGAYGGKPIIIGPQNPDWLTAYLVPALEEIIATGQQTYRERQFEHLKHVRFQADYASPVTSTNSPTVPVTSHGEFTLLGPIDETLTPLRHHQLRHMIRTNHEGESLDFGLDMNGQLVSLGPEEVPDRLTPVPPSREIQSGNRFRGFSYDAQRHRLLLATNKGRQSDIVALDIASGNWKLLASIPHPVVGMTYLPDQDRLWTLLATRQRDTRETAEFWQLQANGEVISRQVLDGTLGDDIPAARRFSSFGSTWDNTFPQLIRHEDLAILVGLRQVPHRPLIQRRSAEAIVIDTKASRVVYAGTLHTRKRDAPAEVRSATSKRPATSALAQFNRQLGRAETQIARLQERDQARAAKLSGELRDLKHMLRGSFPRQTEARLYVVSSYHGGGRPIEIRVTDTSAPVVLAITSQQSNRWQVTAAPGVELQQVLLAGRSKQQLTGALEGVPVTEHFGRDAIPIIDPRNPMSREQAATQLRKLTGGLEITAYQILHQVTGPIDVGPSVGLVRLQMLRRRVDDLVDLAEADELAEVRSTLRDKRFFAVHRGQTPRPGGRAPAEQRSFSEFSIDGPLIGTGHPLTQQFQHVAHDQETKRLFGIVQNRLVIVDLNTGAEESVNLLEKDRQLGQVLGIAFDSKRDELLLMAHSRLFRLDPESKELTTLQARNWYQELGLTYAPSRDAYYTAIPDRSGRGEIRYLHRYNGQGSLVATIELSSPIRTGQHYSSSRLLQIADLDRYVAILDYQSHHGTIVVNGVAQRAPATARIHVVDGESGRLVFEGPLQPTMQRKELSTGRLAQLWDQMGEERPRNLDQRLWELAAGHDGTLTFLRSQIKPQVTALTLLEVAALVKDLDADRFSVREAAFQELQAAGSSIHDLVAGFLEEASSPEVRERLQQLMKSWSAAEPQTEDERRRVRALEVLARMNSPESRTLLQAFGEPPFDALLRHHAARLLSGESSKDGGLQFPQQLFVPR